MTIKMFAESMNTTMEAKKMAEQRRGSIYNIGIHNDWKTRYPGIEIDYLRQNQFYRQIKKHSGINFTGIDYLLKS